jgi:hypothetical protein
MGSGQVVSTIIEWAVDALRDHPLLVAPTLVIALGVVGLAVLEAATITIEVATLMVFHYRHRMTELEQASRNLWSSLSRRSINAPFEHAMEPSEAIESSKPISASTIGRLHKTMRPEPVRPDPLINEPAPHRMRRAETLHTRDSLLQQRLFDRDH